MAGGSCCAPPEVDRPGTVAEHLHGWRFRQELDETYKLAWLRGLKTTYYLRTTSATHAEKSTISAGQLNAVSSGAGTAGTAAAGPATDVKFTAIDDQICESCQ